LNDNRVRPRGVTEWIRSNVLALVAIFIALSGSAAAVQVADTQRPAKSVATAAKSKRGRPGPPGPQGSQGAQGQQGLQGLQGIQGIQGLTGPTYGHSKGSTNPSASADSFLNTLSDGSVSPPTTGNLFVYASAPSVIVNCPTAATVNGGLYVDSVAVPGTGQVLPENTATILSDFGVTSDSLSATTHTVAYGFTCAGAETPTTITAANGTNVGAILLGS